MPAPRARRSELATPASSERMCEKAPTAGADLVFLDLEDACAPVGEGGRAGDRGRRADRPRLGAHGAGGAGQRDRHAVVPRRHHRDRHGRAGVRRRADRAEGAHGPRRLVGGRAARPARGQARAAQAHRPRGADRGRRRAGPRARDRAGERPARGADLRGGRPLGVAPRPRRRELRPGRRVPRRLLALRPRPGAHRGAGGDARRDRRAVPGLRRRRRLPALGDGGQRTRLRRQVGHPPQPGADRQRGVLAHARGGGRGHARRSPRTGRRRPGASAPSGATAGWSTPPTCGWRRTRSTRRRSPAVERSGPGRP